MSARIRFTAIRANARIIPGPETYAALHSYTQGYVLDIVMKLRDYPPVPPTTRRKPYVRTGRLANNWRAKDVSSGVGIQYELYNPVQDPWGRYYSGYVHGPGQASFHGEHGWPLLKDLIDRPKFKAGAQAVIQGVVR